MVADSLNIIKTGKNKRKKIKERKNVTKSDNNKSNAVSYAGDHIQILQVSSSSLVSSGSSAFSPKKACTN